MVADEQTPLRGPANLAHGHWRKPIIIGLGRDRAVNREFVMGERLPELVAGEGDTTQLDVDVIVNTTNSRLASGGNDKVSLN
tara:strand:- start:62 stop:307 length:246 start_codon:yes stop_codon:yes gene_type:complete